MKSILKSIRSIICLNGNVPDCLHLIDTNLPLIASDGGSLKAKKAGLAPTYTVGDGDSCEIEDYIVMDDQNFTDFEKCVQFTKEKNLLPSIVLGVNGGEIDHILGNAQVMCKAAKHGPLYFLDTDSHGTKLGIPLIEGKLTLETKPGCTLSIIPFEKAVLTTHGLEWEYDQTPLSIDTTLGLRNRTTQKSLSLEIHEGKALVILEIT